MWRAIYGSIGLALLLACSGTAAADAPSPDPALLEFFEAKVRPILVDRCFSCHGAEKQKGGLRLDSSDAMRSGGDTGPVVVATDPEHSPLIAAVRHEGDVRMPPKGKLAPAEIAALTEWVKRGAPGRRSRALDDPKLPPPARPSKTPSPPFGPSSRRRIFRRRSSSGWTGRNRRSTRSSLRSWRRTGFSHRRRPTSRRSCGGSPSTSSGCRRRPRRSPLS